MNDVLASKTVRVAFAFAAVGVGAVLFDSAMGVALDYKVRYVPELFGLLSAMFTAITAKNGVDNYFAYSERKTTMLAGVSIENLPPKPVH